MLFFRHCLLSLLPSKELNLETMLQSKPLPSDQLAEYSTFFFFKKNCICFWLCTSCDLQDLSSPTRDWNQAHTAVRVCQVLTAGLLGNSLSFFLFFSFFLFKTPSGGLPWWSSGWDFTFQCRGCGSIPGRRAKIPRASLPKTKTEHRSNIAAHSTKN